MMITKTLASYDAFLARVRLLAMRGEVVDDTGTARPDLHYDKHKEYGGIPMDTWVCDRLKADLDEELDAIIASARLIACQSAGGIVDRLEQLEHSALEDGKSVYYDSTAEGWGWFQKEEARTSHGIFRTRLEALEDAAQSSITT